jgi:ATP-dependent protease ClpP protease subunit
MIKYLLLITLGITNLYSADIKGVVTGFSYINFLTQVESDKGFYHDVHIDSPGGMVIPGFYIIEYIREKQKLGHKFICKVRKAYSMAETILQACDKRIGYTNTSIMQHHGTPTGWISDRFDEIRFNLTRKRLTIPFELFLKEYIKKEKFFGAKEAVRIGVLDKINT